MQVVSYVRTVAIKTKMQAIGAVPIPRKNTNYMASFSKFLLAFTSLSLDNPTHEDLG